MYATTARRFFAVLFLISTAALSAQTEDWYYGKIIKAVEFEGLHNVKSSDLDGVIKPFVGKPFTDGLYSDLTGRLYALDYFDDINPTAHPADRTRETVRLSFAVTERPVVSKLLFSGNSGVHASELREAVTVKESDVFIKSKVLLDEDAIRKLYLKSGYTAPSVTYNTVSGKNGGVEVTFRITEGVPTVVHGISFQGNQVFSEKILRRQLDTETNGFLKKGAFQESVLETDKQKLADYYQKNGYLDVSILDVARTITYNEKEKRNDLSLTFVIQEGVQYQFAGITFEGNTLFSTDELNSHIRLKTGDVFDQNRFRENLAAVYDRYYENGYTANGFVLDTNKDAEHRRVSFVYHIAEYPRSHIENIVVQHNTKTKDRVILRELPIESGDIFSKAKITTGLRNLSNLQFFSAISPNIGQGSEEGLSNIIIGVEEQPTTQVQFGLTFSGVTDPDDWPVSLFLQLSDANVFGTGKNASTSLNVSNNQQSASVGYADSWFLGKPLSFSVSAEGSRKSLSARQNVYYPDGLDNGHYMDYDQVSFSLSTGLGHRWTPDFAILSLSAGMTNNLIKNNYDSALYEPYYETLISDYHDKPGLKNTVWTAFSVDGRDINYDPSKGWFASQRVGWTGLLPGVEKEFFFRTETKAEGYVTLFDFSVSDDWHLKWVLALYSGVSFLFPADEGKISSNSKLYIDGIFNGRGWNDHETYEKREEALWSNYAEIRMPLVPGMLALDFFMDAITLRNKPADLFSDISLNEFYFSFGPGLRFTIPQFPLRLLFANKFRIENGQTKWYKPSGDEAGGPQWGFVLSFNMANR